jgi:parvulin-like peptidyl-prolyl isomerase
MTRKSYLPIAILVCMLLATGCGGAGDGISSPSSPAATAPPSTPTPSPEPLAALVGDVPLTLAEYEDELKRYEGAQIERGIDLATLEDYQDTVLQSLIDRRLLAQGALEAGLALEEGNVRQEIERLTAEVGGIDAFNAWLSENEYTLAEFEAALAEEMLGSMMVDQIVAGVPTSTEQVHARHILLESREEAQAVRASLLSGEDFATLASTVSIDPSTRSAAGDLGWFPRGFLLVPEVEDAVFALGPGELSEIVESVLGFHIIQLTESGVRPLSPEALRQARQEAVETWITDRRQTVAIQVFITP